VSKTCELVATFPSRLAELSELRDRDALAYEQQQQQPVQPTEPGNVKVVCQVVAAVWLPLHERLHFYESLA